MGETTISAKKHILTYGIVLGSLSIIYNIILYVTDNITGENWIKPFINLTILITVISYGIFSFKLANEGVLKLRQALKIGLGIAIVGGIIPFAWQFLLMNFIEPDMINQILGIRKEAILRNNPTISSEKLNQSLVLTKRFSSSYMISLFSLISNLFFGSLTALLAGAIMQRNPDPFE
ncbi:DUF4199 domain-containing protein [Aquimarina sp. AU474]|uniref:DUF4199 domain-containing protein n=1 Tax=Aquimarina sp. AU474 TaxID=2108529 RepID=UPI000D694ECE|nr:DUF4199 domain-containing protein [Aquimarina sp. AU474]